MRNESAERGDADFHRALLRGEILQKMVTPTQREAIHGFMRDAFIARLEQERGFVYCGMGTPAYGWMRRFVSLGLVTPLIERIWNSWWSFNHPGKAVCAVIWTSGLIYWPEENPIFSLWTPNGGGGGPYLSESDSAIYDSVWLPENIQFLKSILTHDYIEQKLDEAAEFLRDEPEYELARRIADDVTMRGETFELKSNALFQELTKPYNHDHSVW